MRSFYEFLNDEYPIEFGELACERTELFQLAPFFELLFENEGQDGVEIGGFTHRTHRRFVELFNALDRADQEKARQQFLRMQENPDAVKLTPNVRGRKNIWQAKVSDGIRALAVKKGNVFIWYWIGQREALNNLSMFDNPQSDIPNPKKVIPGPQRPLMPTA